jgi:hypothetical protein
MPIKYQLNTNYQFSINSSFLPTCNGRAAAHESRDAEHVQESSDVEVGLVSCEEEDEAAEKGAAGRDGDDKGIRDVVDLLQDGNHDAEGKQAPRSKEAVEDLWILIRARSCNYI